MTSTDKFALLFKFKLGTKNYKRVNIASKHGYRGAKLMGYV